MRPCNNLETFQIIAFGGTAKPKVLRKLLAGPESFGWLSISGSWYRNRIAIFPTTSNQQPKCRLEGVPLV
jgi:hypothetical protein